MCNFPLPFLIIWLNILISCNQHNQKENVSKIGNSTQGISSDTLDLIYNGPKGFMLDYFPRDAICSARISYCEIIQQDNSLNRVTRKIRFDLNGNFNKDENIFFWDWERGTARGTYQYLYDKSNNLLQKKGITSEDSKDSVMTVWKYNLNGLLLSIEHFEFKKKLKPGANGHLPNLDDFEKYRTWNNLKTYTYSHNSNIVTIEKIVDGTIAEKNKYILQFDSLNRLQTIKTYEDTTLIKLTQYSYSTNSITGYYKSISSDSNQWTYKSKALINEKGNQIERMFFNDDGSEKVKMIVTYNKNGTINNIRYGDVIQKFNYSYY